MPAPRFPAVVVGCDHGAFDMKEDLKKHIEAAGATVVDVGCHEPTRCDYPDLAQKVVAAHVEREGKEANSTLAILGGTRTVIWVAILAGYGGLAEDDFACERPPFFIGQLAGWATTNVAPSPLRLLHLMLKGCRLLAFRRGTLAACHCTPKIALKGKVSHGAKWAQMTRTVSPDLNRAVRQRHRHLHRGDGGMLKTF